MNDHTETLSRSAVAFLRACGFDTRQAEAAAPNIIADADRARRGELDPGRLARLRQYHDWLSRQPSPIGY